MTAVAERTVLGMLAAAPRHGLFLGDVHHFGRKAGALVRAVAKRLALGFSAGAPVVAGGFHFQDKG